MCLNMTASGVVDGCGADASGRMGSTRTGASARRRRAWDSGHRQMMRETTALGDGVLLGKFAGRSATT